MRSRPHIAGSSRILGPLLLAAIVMASAGAQQNRAGARAAHAQEDSSPRTETLFEFTLEDDELPDPLSCVRLLRITLEPGAISPLHKHTGPEFNLLTDGTLRVEVNGAAIWNPRELGDTPDTGLEKPPADEFIMRGGGSIVYMPGTELAFRNPGSSDAVVLAAVILPECGIDPPGLTWVGEVPSTSTLSGLSSEVLGDGVSADYLPAGKTVVRLERLTLAPGEPIPAAESPALLSLAAGALAFTVQSGSVQVSRTSEPGARPEEEAGTDFSLAIGDGIYVPYGMAEAARANDAGELVLLRLTIAPADETAQVTPVSAQPGVIEITTASQPSPVPEPTVTSTPRPPQIEEGATVVVTDDDVRLRGGPSTDSEIVGVVSTGQVLVVTGPSQEGADYVWWPVQDPNNPALTGFIAADFIQLQEEEGQ